MSTTVLYDRRGEAAKAAAVEKLPGPDSDVRLPGPDAA